MKTTLVALLLLVLAGTAAAADDAAARKALDQQRYREAAQLYAEIRAGAATEAAIGDALYWEAFARYRLGQTAELQQALALLERQAADYAGAATAAEGETLAARIAGELATRGEPAAAREIYELADQDRQREETRVAALHALAQMDPQKALPILAKVVRDRSGSSPGLRENAAVILCRMEGGAAVLLDLLPTETDPAMQEMLIMCLGEMGDDRTYTALADLLQRSDDPRLGAIIVLSLGRHEDPRAATLLAAIVRDQRRAPDVRANALLGLGNAHEEQAAALAAEILRQPDQPEQMLEVSLMTLARSEGERGAAALLQVAQDPAANDDVRAMALYQAGVNGLVDVAELRRIYESTDNGNLRIQVCHVLSQMDDQPGALDLMLHIVRTEPDPEIRQNAVFWIGQFDDPRAADALLEIINER